MAHTTNRTERTCISHCLDWTIENLQGICPTEDDLCKKLCSPALTIHLDKGTVTKWELRLFQRDAPPNMVCSLCLVDYSGPNLSSGALECETNVSLGWPTEPSTHCGNWFGSYKAAGQSYPVHVAPFDFLQRGGQGSMLQDGATLVRLDLKIWLSERMREDTCCDRTASDSTRLEGLSTDLSTLQLSNKEFSDLEIRCASQSFPVHKCILAGRSQTFRAMLATEIIIEESTANILLVEDLEPANLRVLLNYMYTGQVGPVEPESLLSLVHGAHKYDLGGLKDYCFVKLLSCLTNNNIALVAVAAYIYGASPEFAEIIKSFVATRIDSLSTNQGFRQLLKRYPLAFF